MKMSNSVRKKTCAQFCCGGQDCNALRYIFSKDACGALLRLFVGLIIVSVFVGIMYLYLGVFSNFVSMRLFDDSVCTNYPWMSCSSLLLDEKGYRTSNASGWGTFFGFLVSFSVFAPVLFLFSLLVWNCLMNVLVLDDVKARFPIIPTLLVCSLWTWIFLSFNLGLFFAKDFSAAAFNCDFRHVPTTTPFGYAIGVYDAPHHLKWTDYSGLCAPIKYLGYNKGVQIDNSVNTDGCTNCVLKGFWTIFLTGVGIVAIPILIFFFVKLLIRRWNRSKQIVLNDDGGGVGITQDTSETQRLLN